MNQFLKNTKSLTYTLIILSFIFCITPHTKAQTVDAGEAQTVCSETVTLSASEPSLYDYPNSYGKWTIIQGGGKFLYTTETNKAIYSNPAHQPNAKVDSLYAGVNIFRWEFYLNGQSTYDEVVVTNNSVRSTAGEDFWTCGEDFNLAASNPGETAIGFWKVVGGEALIESSNKYNSKVTNLSRGYNTFGWYVEEKGCSAYSEVVVENKSFAVYAGKSMIIDTHTAILDAYHEVGAGKWSIVKGNADFMDITEPKTTVYDLARGVNVFKWTVEYDGCTSSDTVTVIWKDMTWVDAGKDQYICRDSTKMEAIEPVFGDGEWTVISGKVDTIINPTNHFAEIKGIRKGETKLRWTVTMNGFPIHDDISIFNYEFTADAGDEVAICESSYEMNASLPPAVGGASSSVGAAVGTWIIPMGGLTIPADQVNNPNAEVFNLEYGVNNYIWRVQRRLPDNESCISMDTCVIYQNEPPEVDFSIEHDSIAFVNQQFQLFNNTENGTEYAWTFGDGTSSEEINPTHTYKNTGNYAINLVAYSEFGCTDEFTKNIIVKSTNNLEDLQLDNFQVFPNPAKSKINIDFGSFEFTGDFVVEIYTLKGQLVSSEYFASAYEELSIDVSSFSEGNYVLRVLHQNKQIVRQFTVQK